jgi:hypothetical protein
VRAVRVCARVRVLVTVVRQSAVVTRNHRAYIEAHRAPIEAHVRSFAGVRATMRWLLYDCVHTEVGRRPDRPANAPSLAGPRLWGTYTYR